MTLETDDGQTPTLSLDDRIPHALRGPLIAAVKTTGWRLDLAGEFPGSDTAEHGLTKGH